MDQISLCTMASGLPEERVCSFAEFAISNNTSLVKVMAERGGIDEVILLRRLAELLKLEYTSDLPDTIPPDVLEAMPASVVVANNTIPLKIEADVVYAACCDPFDGKRWDDMAFVIGREVRRVLCPGRLISRLIKDHYGIGADTLDSLVRGRSDDDQSQLDAMELSEQQASDEPSVINLIQQIIADAVSVNATDIHFESQEDRFRVRYRIDGMLEDVPISSSLHVLRLAVISRLKIMSGLNIAEKRLPQDGRAMINISGQDFDLRFSVLPGVNGEAVVIRLQNRRSVSLDLKSLGFHKEERSKIEQLISRPYGLILVTGPTGSGKTTTLYTCLNKIRSPETKIITIEDPVEYRMKDILQMQVKSEIGFDFATALRSTLRHDPDVILVGEVRDRETADIAIRSALTGHMVFATLHTNDSPTAVARLCDIGVEPFLLASCMNGILAQRLLRKICPDCKAPVSIDSVEPNYKILIQNSGLDFSDGVYIGQGCEKCRFTGYRGRLAVGEILTVDDETRQSIQQRLPAEHIRQIAIKNGMRSMRQSALIAVANGDTTLSEVNRITQEVL